MQSQGRGRAAAGRLWRVGRARLAARSAGGRRGAAVLAILGAALWHLGPAQAAAAPTREVAGKCRVLAYKVYPYERPGRSPGSGARYALFKDCVDKGGNIDETTLPPGPQHRPLPPPQLGPPPASQPPDPPK